MTSQKRKCTGTRLDRKPCTASAAPGTNPPRCWRHPPARARAGPETKTPTPKRKKKVGAPKDNKNAQKHGGYSGGPLPIDLTARIAALDKRLQHVENFFDIHADTLSPEEYIKLAALQGQLLSRLDRLMRGRDDDPVSKAETDIDAVLQVLSTTYGIDLVGSKKK